MLQRNGEVTCVHNSPNFTDINSMKSCKERDIETCALKLQLNSVNRGYPRC
jgi:hypothetical protein